MLDQPAKKFKSGHGAGDDLKEVIIEAGERRAPVDAIDKHEDESKDDVKELQAKVRWALKKLL